MGASLLLPFSDLAGSVLMSAAASMSQASQQAAELFEGCRPVQEFQLVGLFGDFDLLVGDVGGGDSGQDVGGEVGLALPPTRSPLMYQAASSKAS